MGSENSRCNCCLHKPDQDTIKFDRQNGFISEPTMIPNKGNENIVEEYSLKDLKQFAEFRANSVYSLNPNEKRNSIKNNTIANTNNNNSNSNINKNIDNFHLSKENSKQSNIFKNGKQFTLNPQQDTISHQSSLKKDIPGVSFFTLQSKSNYKHITLKEPTKEDVTIIQSFYKGYSYRKKYYNSIENELIDHLNSLLKKLYQSYLTDNLKEQEKRMSVVHNENTHLKLYQFEKQKKADLSHFVLNNIYNRKTTKLNYTLNVIVLFTRLSINAKEESFYIGEINIKNEKHGKGVSYNSRGCKYEGDWEYNNFTGTGKYIDKEGSLYEGNFIKGLLNGKGTKKMLNDCFYTGQFVNSIRSGKGIEKASEHIYEGDFFRDIKNGKGKLTYIHIRDEYEGDFEDNMINGTGKYNWSNGESYIGTFVNGKMHGKGVYKWPDGGVYEGDYTNNIKEGFGVFKWSDNKIYKGEFKKGRPSGKGILESRGKKYNAVFKDGKLITKTEL